MWDKLKQILSISNGRAVIVEDGEPRYIVLTIEEYLALKGVDSGVSGNEGVEHNGLQQPHTGNGYVSENPIPNTAPAADLSGINTGNANSDQSGYLGYVSNTNEYPKRDISLDDLPL